MVLTLVVVTLFIAGVLLSLREISAVLARVEYAGLPSASMGALTSWHWPPWDGQAILSAFETWALAAQRPGLVESWVEWHLLVDSLLFVPAYVLLLTSALRSLVAAKRLAARWAVWLPLILGLVDLLENLMTWLLLQQAFKEFRGRIPGPADVVPAPLQRLAQATAVVTDLKWILVAVSLAALAVGLLGDRDERGRPWWWTRIAGLATALRVPIVTVGALAFLMVVPGGGPLDQVPDVLRAQADTESPLSWGLPTLSLFVFAVAVWMAAWVASRAPAIRPDEPADQIGVRFPLIGLALLAVGLLLWWQLRDSGSIVVTPGILSLPLVLLAACASVWLIKRMAVPAPLRATTELFTGEAPSPQVIRVIGRAGAAAAVGIGGLAIVRAFVGPALTSTVEWQSVIEWLVIGCLATLLAPLLAWPAFILAERWLGWNDIADAGSDETGTPAERTGIPADPVGISTGTSGTIDTSSGPSTGTGDTTTDTAGVVTDAAGTTTGSPTPNRIARWVLIALRAPVLVARWMLVALRTPVRGAGWVLVATLGATACLLAYRPEWAEPFTPPGVLSLVLAAVTLIAVLVDTSGFSRHPGPVTRGLGFQTRPVFLVTLAVFVLAGQLDDVVRYHAARLEPPDRSNAPMVMSATRPSQATNPGSLDSEFMTWSRAAAQCLRDIPPEQPVEALPMVLVAAPGGGIRAAYWTARAMRRLNDEPCGTDLIFAASGVSGSAVGLAVWGVDPGRADANVEKMSRPGPLTRSLAAMLLRDLPRGLTGIHFPVADRAAVLEDGWATSVSPESPNDRLLDRSFDTLRQVAEGWTPHVVLSGTDLQRGCRVVISTFSLGTTTPAVGTADSAQPVDPANCSAAPAVAAATAGSGFASGTLDVRQLVDQEPCPDTATRTPYLRVSTAALLSARFPLVSPTGGLVVCHRTNKGKSTESRAIQVLVGDGGYRDNSAITTLLELWRKLEPAVARHNEAGNLPVVPVFVVLDNHYRSSARGPVPDRTPELLAILEGADAQRHPASQGVLEQLLALEATKAVPGLPTSGRKAAYSRWHVVAPAQKPEPAAPLGWVLSDLSRGNLDRQMDRQDAPLAGLTKALMAIEAGSGIKRA